MKVSKYLFAALIVGIMGLGVGSEMKAQKENLVVAQNSDNQDVWSQTKDVSEDIWSGTKEVASDVWSGTKEVTSDVWEGAKKVTGDITDAATSDEKPPHEKHQNNKINSEK